MKKDFLEENWKALVALTLGLGVGALIAKALQDGSCGDDEHGVGQKDFACIKLPKEALERYHEKKCKVLKLEFDLTGSGKVKLKLKGFGWTGIIPRVTIPLHVEREGCYSSDEPLRGKFKHDASGTPLHDLIADDPSQFRDWWLRPVKCDLDPTLVSYILDDRLKHKRNESRTTDPTLQGAQTARAEFSALAAYRLNPSPPY